MASSLETTPPGPPRCRAAEAAATLAELLGEPVLEPLLHRAGIRAAIVEGGELHAGDEIASLDE